ncbi:ATP-binding cassette domain-containing protein [Paenibacillus sp. TRM 82003]|uniref:ABC-F family ATP-binding cassette domain-containing protein n=1 Tax=Kineococcus sp. TRM81007 TaxID=2925831 RepID=UPI001F56051A|nr:ABC-F family ATP-binding cassette domain-containing protein [Kineococcus sp. TRM81007]MCI2238430.1 ATP-binding cassette domain-containing protein [Kineococcus sp. TRM81007]MCI3922056.1 ATP-binding cassette domain-containing protein [Paenibacillus sp. TRM 82003]
MPAANLVSAEALTVVHGSRTLLDAVSLGVSEGDRIGVVGRNGDGKSTLLRLLAKQQEPDGGRVTHTGGLRMSMLAQADALPPATTVREAVLGDLPEHAWASQPRVRDVVAGLLGDLDASDVGGLDTAVGTLSGGQRRRVGLAALLAADPAGELLVLDEPTNHLDVEGVAWLAQHLRTRWAPGSGALLVVTHDRWFLDAVCERVWEVHDGVVDPYDGGYAAYVLTRAERARVAAVTEERRQNLLRKELAWLRRGAPARTSKPRFRIDAANALIEDVPPLRDSVELARMATTRLGKDVVDLEDVSLSYGPKRLLDHVTWRLGPGDRVGVVGVNGAGKSTVLGLVNGTVQPDAGRVKRGSTVVVATLSQEVRELDEVGELRALEAVDKVASHVRLGDRDVPAGQLLERLGFTAQRAWTRVDDLSGGERRRLQLLRLLMAEPNVLLLDEPTNDLDTDTLAAVEDLLDGWPGTLVVVSHDRYLLERITDRQVALLGDGAVRDLPGGVEEYLQRRAAAKAAQVAAPAGGAGGGAARRPAADGAAVRAARKEMARVERQLDRLAQQEERLHAELAERATDLAAVTELDGRLRALGAEREQLEQAWLEASELVE